MKSFWRVFEYIWPQWPRLIVIALSVLCITFLFALSFATIVPLLKVMMGEEGLHGWVDRKVCNWRYGMDFYVPEIPDFLENDGNDIAYYLLVTHVEKNSFVEKAGLLKEDRIIGVGNFLVEQDLNKVPRSRLIEELATTDSSSCLLQIKRPDNRGRLHTEQIVLVDVPEKRSYYNWCQSLALTITGGRGKSDKVQVIVFIVTAMLVVTIIRCIATFYQKYMAQKVVEIAAAHLREDVIRHVLKMPIGFFVSQGTSDTVSRILRDIGQTAAGIKVFLGKALREPMKAVGTLSVALIINWRLTLIFMAAAPAAIGFGFFLGRKIKKATKKSLLIWAKMFGKLEDMIGALRVVKVYNRQEYEYSSYKDVNRKLLKRMLRISKVDSATGPIMEVLGMFAGSAALLFGVHWVVSANMKSSSFFGILIALGVTAESIRKSSDVWNKIQMSTAAAERVFSVLDEPLETEGQGVTDIAPMRKEIEFQNVVFTYPGSEKPVLNRVDLKVQAGHNMAIVGPNGSGKTTLANLIPRFYDPDSGKILIDGTDIQNVTLHSLRDQISMVTQEVVTFNDTIAANIAYGKPNVTREEIIEAAKRAYAHEFIAPLPDAYDSIIGEHGSGLSGGQLQRIVIARAILKNPAILIFDEATSQVDAESEAKIHKAIEEIMQDRTSIIIAHRFSTVISADVIVVMDNGQIIAQGQHEELIKSCPLYQSLYETQLVAS